MISCSPACISTHHDHALDGFLLPVRESRLEYNIIVLQHAKAERAQRVVRRQHGPILQCDLHAVGGVRYVRYGRVEYELLRLQELSSLRLDEMFEPALVDGHGVGVSEAALVRVIREIVSLSKGHVQSSRDHPENGGTCLDLPRS